MIGTFSPSNSALLLIDHRLGAMKLIKNIPLDLARRNNTCTGQDRQDFKTTSRSYEFARRESPGAVDARA